LTQAEIEQRLSRRHDEREIKQAVRKLKEYRFLDDDVLIADFARDRLRHSPRSAELIEAELERRGIEPDHFRRVFAAEFPDYDELEVARAALRQHQRALTAPSKKSAPQAQRERALRFLRSRGFSYDVMLEAWEEFRKRASIQQTGDFEAV
jgi:regulatory protein